MIRVARADLKRRIGMRHPCADGGPVGRRALLDAVLYPAPEYEGMKLFDMILAQERWGVTRTRKLFRSLRMNELKTAGSLTQRQREVLADVLGRV